MSGKGSDFSQELCSAFWKGFPIENLRPLILAKDPDILSLGAYLIYELGAKVRPLIDDIIPLLDNSEPEIRANAIIALEECATKFDNFALGKIIELLGDPDSFVQRIAMRFVQSCERSLLQAGVLNAARRNPDTIFDMIPIALFRRGRSVPVSADTLRMLLSHSHPVAQRFGVGLATRPRQIVDEGFIDLAEQIEDRECRNLVRWARERPCLTYFETLRL